MVKIAKYRGFCVYRRSYLIWSPVIGVDLAENVIQEIGTTGISTHTGHLIRNKKSGPG